MKKFKKFLPVLISSLLCFCLAGCGSMTGTSRGHSGGMIPAVFQEGVTEKCSMGNSATAEGKVTEIDGVEIKMPIDWNYAITNQPDFIGNNWEGGDEYRGIGMYNCNEEGDGSQEFADSYSINMRWEYIGYTTGVEKWPTQGGYVAYAASIPDMKIGGTDASCRNSGNDICYVTDADNAQYAAMKKVKIIAYNPVTEKACVCAPGFIASGISEDLNWGGAPLFGIGGITTAVCDALSEEGVCTFNEMQPHTGDDNIAIETFFCDPDTPLGPCEFNGGSAVKTASHGKNSCFQGSYDNSDAATLAVTVSYDENNPTYAGHEMIQYVAGSTSEALLPTTEKATIIRKLATDGANDRTADCGFFVASVVILTLDKDYPKQGTGSQRPYCEASDKWEKVLANIKVPDAYASGLLQPGDVFITDETVPDGKGHTTMFVGNEAIKAQYDYASDDIVIVGASWDDYGPKIQKASETRRPYNVYRYVGDPNPSENAADIPF